MSKTLLSGYGECLGDNEIDDGLRKLLEEIEAGIEGESMFEETSPVSTQDRGPQETRGFCIDPRKQFGYKL